MRFESTRRGFLVQLSGAGAALLRPWAAALAAEAPRDDPLAPYRLGWTGLFQWGRVVSIDSAAGQTWDERFANAQKALGDDGGIVYFPAGHYAFRDHLRLNDGVVIRGADPKVVTRATQERYDPPAKFEFLRYDFVAEGDGTPIDSAFKGIHLANPAGGGNTGVVNVDVNRGHIHLGEGGEHKCDGNRVVFGCVLSNAAAADARVPDVKIGQHRWQRFTDRHFAAIDVKGPNVLIANNRMPKSGDDNFVMKDFRLREFREKESVFDVVFDYDNRPGMYINHYCVGGPGGSGNDGTPDTHPHGFRKGIVIADNYVYNSGRMGIGFSGEGVICARNVTRIEKDVWRPTVTGHVQTTGSSTNDNRAIEMRGWRWVVEDNDCEVHKNWAADRKYHINDGEGLMHEDHCNSTIRDSRLVNNRVNSYLSIYKCGPIDGLHIEGNDVSTPGKIADIYVVANRNSGKQPCRNVSIVNNVTRSNGIQIAGSPAEGNVVKGNRHRGEGKGVIRNEAGAVVAGNEGYDGA